MGQGDELDPVSELQQQLVQRDIELADQKYQRVQLQAELRRLKEESSYADVFALYVLTVFFVSSATTAEYALVCRDLCLSGLACMRLGSLLSCVPATCASFLIRYESHMAALEQDLATWRARAVNVELRTLRVLDQARQSVPCA